jgi:lysophospholipase L1-like esterase
MRLWPTKTLLAIAAFCAIITLPEFIPQLYNWHVYEWATLPSVLDFQPRRISQAPIEEEIARMRPDVVAVHNNSQRVRDPARALEPFYTALLRVERLEPGATVRVLHYGDSPTTADLITADMRTLMQQRFGDAGHGAYLIARPWAWYNHRGFEGESSGWKMDPATLRAQKDGMYGLAGVSFTGSAGAWSRVRIRRADQQRIAVTYMAQPGGGTLSIRAGDLSVAEIETNRPDPGTVREEFNLPEETESLEVRVTAGKARVFSLEFVKQPPGVVYDSLGLNGVWAGVMAHYVNEQHWGERLKEAKPDLVIINYGTNESGFPQYVDSTYERDMRRVVQRVRRALPNTSVLVMSPMDRGARERAGTIGTMPALPRIITIQAKIAAEEGCAFFNTFEAMGGPGTMGKWYMAEPRLVSADFIHPLPAGGRIVATLLYQGLMEGFNQYKLRLLRNQMAAAQPAPGSKP